jgi:zinc D-Ala-D-Ala carboxypeptidase
VNNQQIQHMLNAYGFPCGPEDGVVGPQTTAAIMRFQEAWNGHPWLALDGVAGPLTQSAMSGLPNLSAHFTVDELKSKGNGTCYVRRELLAALETLRAHMGAPLSVIDAYRDPAHNAAVGGASDSMHLYGLAADVIPTIPIATVELWRIFSGIGDRRGLLSHGDLRHLSPANETPAATIYNPARWTYP